MIISKSEGLNSQEFSADLLRDLLAVTVYGKPFVDPDKAERYKRAKIRGALKVINAQREITKTPLGEISESQQGVLDAHIAKSNKYIPISQQKIKDIEYQLRDEKLVPYKRGRLMRDLEDLKDREATHVEIRETCTEQLNQFYESSNDSALSEES